MIAFDLVCGQAGHRFEGWFASSADYDRQLATGLLCCPLCGDVSITKAVMAPNVGRKGNQSAANLPAEADKARAPALPVSNSVAAPEQMQAMMQKLAQMQAALLEKSDWVGRDFADEARAIHYGEAPDRIIHGETTLDQARELLEEGVGVAPLPFPTVPPEAKN